MDVIVLEFHVLIIMYKTWRLIIYTIEAKTLNWNLSANKILYITLINKK